MGAVSVTGGPDAPHQRPRRAHSRAPPEHGRLANLSYSSPGVWHRAEGTPKKGGLRWGPRAMCGAFWGDSKGGGCDGSLWTAGR